MIKRLREDLKVLMKAKDLEKMNVIRAVLNEIMVREMKDIKIDDDEVVKVIRSEIKKRKEAVESFQKGNRMDLADKENREIAQLEKYLPADLTDEQLQAKIAEIVKTAQDKSFGAVMKAAIAAVAGAADGKRISAAVKKALES
jgi:uncharacterized protein YqeY